MNNAKKNAPFNISMEDYFEKHRNTSPSNQYVIARTYRGADSLTVVAIEPFEKAVALFKSDFQRLKADGLGLTFIAMETMEEHCHKVN